MVPKAIEGPGAQKVVTASGSGFALPRPRRLSLSQMRETVNRVILAPDVGCLQIALVAAQRVIPIASVT